MGLLFSASRAKTLVFLQDLTEIAAIPDNFCFRAQLRISKVLMDLSFLS